MLHTADDAAVATDARRPSSPPFRYCPHSFTSSSHASETIHSWQRCTLSTGEADIIDDDDVDNSSDESSESHSADSALVGDTASGAES